MKTGSLLCTCTLLNVDGRGETIVAPEKPSTANCGRQMSNKGCTDEMYVLMLCTDFCLDKELGYC